MRKWRPWMSMWVWLVGTACESTGSDGPDAGASYDAAIVSDATTDDSGSHATCGGCLCVDPTWSCPDTTRVNARGEAVELAKEVGMLELAIDDASSARMWYSFYPADEAPEDKPVMLIFNGGPYSATMLSGTGTGPVNAYDEELANNPGSWTRFANLLYVDPANTGFSYVRGRDTPLQLPEDSDLFVRTLLAFLQRHPALTDNRVGLVGESYGGTRILLMLDQVFGTLQFGDRSAWLEDALAAHFLAVFGERSPSLERIAEQFAFQVHIQGSIGELFGGNCPGEERSSYDCSLASGVLTRQTDRVFDTFVNPERWLAFYGHDLATVAWLRPEHRRGVRHNRASTRTLDEAMVRLLGPLEAGDAYYVTLSALEETGLGTMLYPRLTRAFVDHAGRIGSLLTDAADDTAIATSRFPEAARGAEVPDLVDVVHDMEPRSGIARPGWIRITFEGDRVLEIRAPRYEAGHMVPIRAGRELAEDVEALLAER